MTNVPVPAWAYPMLGLLILIAVTGFAITMAHVYLLIRDTVRRLYGSSRHFTTSPYARRKALP